MRRILFIQLFLIFIILFIGIISFLKFQDDRIIFERIIAQEDISTINNNSLLLQNDKDMLIVYAPVKFKSTTWGVPFISPLSNNNNNNNKSIT